MVPSTGVRPSEQLFVALGFHSRRTYRFSSRNRELQHVLFRLSEFYGRRGVMPAGADRCAQYRKTCAICRWRACRSRSDCSSSARGWCGWGCTRRIRRKWTRWSLVFLFFAVGFWPAWIPLSVRMVETRPRERTILTMLTVIGLVWMWLFGSIAAVPAERLKTEIVQHSIRYDVSNLPAFDLAPRLLWRVGYLVVICGSLMLLRFPSGGSSKSGALVAC